MPHSAPRSAERPSSTGVFIHPGEHHFGQAPGYIKTLLGSCVSVTVWDPAKRVGGMCHALLPKRQRPCGAPLDGRFTDEAIEILWGHLKTRGIAAQSCQVQLFGGGRMFSLPELAGLDVGQRNIEVAHHMLAQLGLPLQHVDVGGVLPRRLHFDLASGLVSCTQGPQSTKERL
ncbi:MAG TPA: chemotaxis protein CheD [Burkholderiaceae bacterium]|nr:chemotaxis protein CheD [Burkholderiaceae bacterium]